MEGIARYADPETGMYCQVPDQPGRAGNYLETSGSSMVAYAMLKGARLGVLDKEYAAKGQKTFSGIGEKYLSFTGDTLNLGTKSYLFRRVESYYFGNQPIYLWGLCVEKGVNDTWGTQSSN